MHAVFPNYLCGTSRQCSILFQTSPFFCSLYQLYARCDLGQLKSGFSFAFSALDFCKSSPQFCSGAHSDMIPNFTSTCVISVIRILTLKSASLTRDPTWDNVATMCWSVTELCCGIICACIPTLRPLAMQLCSRMMQSRSRNIADGYEMQHSFREIHVNRDFGVVYGRKDSL